MPQANKEQQEVRDFIDALRVCRGQAPLYKQEERSEKLRFVPNSSPADWCDIEDLGLHIPNDPRPSGNAAQPRLLRPAARAAQVAEMTATPSRYRGA